MHVRVSAICVCLFQCIGVEGKQAQQRAHYLSICTCDRWRPRKRGTPTWGTSVACRLAEQSSGPLQSSSEMRWLLRSSPLGPPRWEAGEGKYRNIKTHNNKWTINKHTNINAHCTNSCEAFENTVLVKSLDTYSFKGSSLF